MGYGTVIKSYISAEFGNATLLQRSDNELRSLLINISYAGTIIQLDNTRWYYVITIPLEKKSQ